jgi:hypothetical protein
VGVIVSGFVGRSSIAIEVYSGLECAQRMRAMIMMSSRVDVDILSCIHDLMLR